MPVALQREPVCDGARMHVCDGALQQSVWMRPLAVPQRQVRALPCSHATADGRLAMVDVDQLLASEEQFLLAEAQAMEQACADAFAGQEVGARVARGVC